MMGLGAIFGLFSRLPAAALSLFTSINIGSVFSSVSGFFIGVWNSIIKYPFQWLTASLILTNILFFYEWRHTDANLVKEKASHVKDINDFKTAQTLANAKAVAVQAALKKESQADADQADANYTGLLAKYRASIVRYSTNQSASKQSDHYQLPTTQGGNGPSSDPELPKTITIPGSDAEICAVNTARLQAVHDWALALPKEVSP